jgi:hypothetical protein
LGSPSRWATAVQLSPSLRQSSTASCLCCAVNRRRVLVGLVIDRQSEGHGVTPIDLSLKFLGQLIATLALAVARVLLGSRSAQPCEAALGFPLPAE